jgi:hypothetical protein
MAKFTGTITLSDYEAETILTTAVEGGIGYWSLITDCERHRDPEHPDYLSWISVDLVDAEDESEVFGTVNKQTIEKGVSLIVSGKVKISNDLRAQVFTLLSDETWTDSHGRTLPEFDIDASAADCIVQAGLFGEIIYG